jgi:hypothetical protein
MSIKESIIKRLVRVEKEISSKKGSFILFALFQRMDIWNEKNQEKWDLVISASWINDKNMQNERKYIFNSLLKELKGEEIAGFIEKLNFINPKDQFIRLITKSIGLREHESGDAKSIDEEKKHGISNAYVITSRPQN